MCVDKNYYDLCVMIKFAIKNIQVYQHISLKSKYNEYC